MRQVGALPFPPLVLALIYEPVLQFRGGGGEGRYRQRKLGAHRKHGAHCSRGSDRHPSVLTVEK